MKKQSLILTIIGYSFFALSAIMLLLSLFLAFDPSVGYFSNNILPTIFKISFVSGLACFLTIYFIHKKDSVAELVENKTLHLIIYICLSIISIILIYFCYKAFNVNFSFKISSISRYLAIIGIFALSIYFVLSAFNLKFANIPLYFTVLFPIAFVMQCIFDYTYHINSFESKAISLFSIFFLVFIIEEQRSKIKGKKNVLYCISLVFLFAFGMAIGIPYIIFALISREYHSFFAVVSILSIFISAFSIYKKLYVKF